MARTGIPDPEQRIASFPASALGRPAATGDDRHGPGLPAGPADCRRTDHRSRCHHPGPDPRTAGRYSAGDRHGHPADHPRSAHGQKDCLAIHIMQQGRIVEYRRHGEGFRLPRSTPTPENCSIPFPRAKAGISPTPLSLLEHQRAVLQFFAEIGLFQEKSRRGQGGGQGQSHHPAGNNLRHSRRVGIGQDHPRHVYPAPGACQRVGAI